MDGMWSKLQLLHCTVSILCTIRLYDRAQYDAIAVCHTVFVLYATIRAGARLALTRLSQPFTAFHGLSQVFTLAQTIETLVG